tara:strand:+ start:677 stop:1183 length:507 start_codon:yes stop_codon:yes gene_type:complete
VGQKTELKMQVRTPADEDTDDDAWGNRADCAVPYWSKENIWLDAGDGILQSRDLTPDFKPNLISSKSKTRFGMQDAPTFPRATKPDLRVPLGPRNGNGNGNQGPLVVATGPHLNVAVSTLCTEVAKQEAETAALNVKLARMERELVLLRKILHGFIEVHMIYHDRGQI